MPISITKAEKHVDYGRPFIIVHYDIPDRYAYRACAIAAE